MGSGAPEFDVFEERKGDQWDRHIVGGQMQIQKKLEALTGA